MISYQPIFIQLLCIKLLTVNARAMRISECANQRNDKTTITSERTNERLRERIGETDDADECGRCRQRQSNEGKITPFLPRPRSPSSGLRRSGAVSSSSCNLLDQPWLDTGHIYLLHQKRIGNLADSRNVLYVKN